jgi:hypothetical protein
MEMIQFKKKIGLLECGAVYFGRCVPVFRWNLRPSLWSQMEETSASETLVSPNRITERQTSDKGR